MYGDANAHQASKDACLSMRCVVSGRVVCGRAVVYVCTFIGSAWFMVSATQGSSEARTMVCSIVRSIATAGDIRPVALASTRCSANLSGQKCSFAYWPTSMQMLGASFRSFVMTSATLGLVSTGMMHGAQGCCLHRQMVLHATTCDASSCTQSASSSRRLHNTHLLSLIPMHLSGP